MSNGLDPDLDQQNQQQQMTKNATGKEELITNLVTSAIVSLYLLELLSSYPENDQHKIHRGYSIFGMNMLFISSSEAKNAYFMSGK